METGISAEQIEAFKKKFLIHARDRLKLRLMVTGAIFGLGLFAYLRPKAQGLDAARAKLAKLTAQATTAGDLRHCVEQERGFSDRVPKAADITDWQNYIVEKLDLSGATLRKLEPRKSVRKARYRFIYVEVECEGMFPQVLDFLDRLERGHRLVRFDRLTLEKRKTTIAFRGVVMGLVRSGGNKPGALPATIVNPASTGDKAAGSPDPEPKPKPVQPAVAEPTHGKEAGTDG